MNQTQNQPQQNLQQSAPKIALRSVNPDQPITQWDGKEKHPDGIITIIGYQDILQNILMCRFIKNIKEYFGTVYYLAPRALVDLLQNLEGCDGVYEFESDSPGATHYIPLGDGLRNLSLVTDGLPYINVPDYASDKWSKRIPERDEKDQNLRIGLMWDNEQGEISNNGDLNFFLMSNFLRLDMHEFFSLQTGASSLRNQVHYFNEAYSLVDLFPYLSDFTEVAGAISRLDLLITSDNATAHLAASMGCNVWLLGSADLRGWYWDLEQRSIEESEVEVPEGSASTRATMWYQTMRIIQQSAAGDWRQPLQLAMNNLARLRRKAGGVELAGGDGSKSSQTESKVESKVESKAKSKAKEQVKAPAKAKSKKANKRS